MCSSGLYWGVHTAKFIHWRTTTAKKFFNYNKNRDWAENLQIIMQLGLTMAGCIIFCFFVGWYIDKWLGTRGIFVTIFILLGIIGGGNVAYRQIMDLMGQEKDRETKNRE